MAAVSVALPSRRGFLSRLLRPLLCCVAPRPLQQGGRAERGLWHGHRRRTHPGAARGSPLGAAVLPAGGTEPGAAHAQPPGGAPPATPTPPPHAVALHTTLSTSHPCPLLLHRSPGRTPSSRRTRTCTALPAPRGGTPGRASRWCTAGGRTSSAGWAPLTASSSTRALLFACLLALLLAGWLAGWYARSPAAARLLARRLLTGGLPRARPPCTT